MYLNESTVNSTLMNKVLNKCSTVVYKRLVVFSRPVVSDSESPGVSVPHHLPEFAQVHVHCIDYDTIQMVGASSLFLNFGAPHSGTVLK